MVGNKMVAKTQKELEVRPAGALGFVVRWKGGGELPKMLKGAFTSPKEAQKAIDVFKASK